ncbi:Kelch repeat-containing protein, partial [Archangium sp.]|uniref:Kelch repeat-containing protein n=1 Tax=Archangium sp. TaxID=1872627 RepID=UPI002ED9D88B
LGSIPAGLNRTFLAQAFDSSGTLLFQGSAPGVTISADLTALVAITLQQVNAPPPFQNAAPLIDSLVASSTSTSVLVGSTLSLTATAHDSNPGDTLTYAWSSTAGSFASASSAATSWTAPGTPGIQTLTFTVTDSGGLSSRMSLTVNVVPNPAPGSAQLSISFNTAPQVAALSASPTRLAVGQTTSVSASASDPEGDSLSYAWSASCAGSWAQASSRSAEFTPSALPEGRCNNCRLTVSVSDGRGGQTTGSVGLCVSGPASANHFHPFILSASGSSGLASPSQVLTYEVVASDPEGSALSFSWAANTGVLGTPAHSATSSRITWTAPSCGSASTPLELFATVTNAFHLTATQRFSVMGLPTCARSDATGFMGSPRTQHTATLLPDGKVLVVGGGNGAILATAEVYDPALGTWSAVAPLSSPRQRHTATLLPDGKVLVAGGDGQQGIFATAEVYDPGSNTWSMTGPMVSARLLHAATPLLNGKVLVTGGLYNRDGEVYDPASSTWSATGAMTSPRFYHTATRLPSGEVLVAGGINETGGPSATAELYEPASGSWRATGAMASLHVLQTATLLSDGRVLIAGEAYGPPPLVSAEVYDPALGTWSAAAPMVPPRTSHTATLLPNGRVLVSGGYGSDSSLAAEYDPAADAWSEAISLAAPRSSHTATLLPNGKVLVSGGSGGSGAVAAAELYTPLIP